MFGIEKLILDQKCFFLSINFLSVYNYTHACDQIIGYSKYKHSNFFINNNKNMILSKTSLIPHAVLNTVAKKQVNTSTQLQKKSSYL